MQTPEAGEFFPLGFNPHGDFAIWTIYTSRRGRVVRFTRAPPTTPPTWLQRRQWSAWTAAAALWATLPAASKQEWNTCVQVNHLKISGHNLFMHYWTGANDQCLETLKQPPTT